jgi:hypothetical protein
MIIIKVELEALDRRTQLKVTYHLEDIGLLNFLKFSFQF